VFITALNGSGMIQWSTYLGGSNDDNLWVETRPISRDVNGGFAVTGFTNSTNFPLAGAMQSSIAGGYDAFITRFSSSGGVLWSTYYGGDQDERGEGIGVWGNGILLCTGNTRSTNLPVANPIQSYAGGGDIFIIEISQGNLQWGTYYGGSDSESRMQIAVQPSGVFSIGGSTRSTNFPVQNAYQGNFGGGNADLFIARFGRAMTNQPALQWSTYYGGSGIGEGLHGITHDANGNVIFTGGTGSNDFPVSIGAMQSSRAGSLDAYLVKFSGSGSRIWSTFWGGSGTDYGRGCTMQPSGEIVIVGRTYSLNFPVYSAIQQNLAGGSGDDAFISSFTANGYVPVELISFDAVCVNGHVYLNWETASEWNNYGFIVERAKDKEGSWSEAGFFPACTSPKRSCTYDFTDKILSSGIDVLYYRLRQVDYDGKEELSPVIAVATSGAINAFAIDEVFPNPARGHSWITISVQEDATIRLSLFDALGKRVKNVGVEKLIRAGTSTVRLDLSGLRPGLYHVSAENGSRRSVRKLILE